jgi:hypothetical protein
MKLITSESQFYEAIEQDKAFILYTTDSFFCNNFEKKIKYYIKTLSFYFKDYNVYKYVVTPDNAHVVQVSKVPQVRVYHKGTEKKNKIGIFDTNELKKLIL